jgi:hypothetical protein
VLLSRSKNLSRNAFVPIPAVFQIIPYQGSYLPQISNFGGSTIFFMVNKIRTTPEGRTTFYSPCSQHHLFKATTHVTAIDLDGFYCVWAILLYFMCYKYHQAKYGSIKCP